MTKYIVLAHGSDFFYDCWSSSIDGVRVRFINSMLPYEGNKLAKKLAYTHYRVRTPWACKLPFTSVWYKSIDRTLAIDDSCHTVLIIYDWNFLTKDFGCLQYLKEKHNKLKVIYLFSNIVRSSGASKYRIVEKLKDNYDAVYAFERQDAEKYRFYLNPLIYKPTVSLPEYSQNLEYDLFFLGRAKDRYNQLIEIFEEAKNEGLSCNFTIVGVPKENRKYEGEIHYEPVPYAVAVENMGKSKCIVDAIQGNSTALTIKTCEAVLLGRKLLTTNVGILKEPFYHNGNILIYILDKCNIEEFIKKPYVKYTEKEKKYFSPEALMDKVEKLFNI